MTSLVRELVAGIVQVVIILVAVWSVGALIGLAVVGFRMVAG